MAFDGVSSCPTARDWELSPTAMAPALRDMMGKRGAQKAMVDFNEARVVQRVMDCYRKVAQRKNLVDLASELISGIHQR